MRGIDILAFCLSILGMYGCMLYLRYLLPRNAVPLVSALLNETQQLLDHAETIGAVPPRRDCRTLLYRLEDEFVAMRIESNHARGIFKQLRFVLRGLTYELYTLSRRIGDIKSEIELAVDKHRLRITESATA